MTGCPLADIMRRWFLKPGKKYFDLRSTFVLSIKINQIFRTAILTHFNFGQDYAKQAFNNKIIAVVYYNIIHICDINEFYTCVSSVQKPFNRLCFEGKNF